MNDVTPTHNTNTIEIACMISMLAVAEEKLVVFVFQFPDLLCGLSTVNIRSPNAL